MSNQRYTPCYLGHPQQASTQSACAATPDNDLPQGGVQSARGRLPDAKIGANAAHDRLFG
jgi:hypothetical protein